jgi:hypothetical protein
MWNRFRLAAISSTSFLTSEASKYFIGIGFSLNNLRACSN